MDELAKVDGMRPAPTEPGDPCPGEQGDAPNVANLAAPAAHHRRDAGSELDSSAVVELHL